MAIVVRGVRGKAVGAVRMLHEVGRVVTRVADAVLGEEYAIRVIGPSGASET